MQQIAAKFHKSPFFLKTGQNINNKQTICFLIVFVLYLIKLNIEKDITMKDTKYTLTPCKFSIEDDPIFEGFYCEDYNLGLGDGKYWNGWLNPYVTKEVKDQILNFYCPPKVRDELLKKRETCEDFEDFDEENPWLEYWNLEADKETGLYYFGGMFIWEERE